jgi:hypothetical protein
LTWERSRIFYCFIGGCVCCAGEAEHFVSTRANINGRLNFSGVLYQFAFKIASFIYGIFVVMDDAIDIFRFSIIESITIHDAKH